MPPLPHRRQVVAGAGCPAPTPPFAWAARRPWRCCPPPPPPTHHPACLPACLPACSPAIAAGQLLRAAHQPRGPDAACKSTGPHWGDPWRPEHGGRWAAAAVESLATRARTHTHTPPHTHPKTHTHTPIWREHTRKTARPRPGGAAPVAPHTTQSTPKHFLPGPPTRWGLPGTSPPYPESGCSRGAAARRPHARLQCAAACSPGAAAAAHPSQPLLCRSQPAQRTPALPAAALAAAWRPSRCHPAPQPPACE